jgi:hypothetical protein
MKRLNHWDRIIGRSACTAVWVFITAVSAWGAMPLGTAFTYQGRIERNGSPVSDACDFQFSLWEDAGGVTQVGATQTITGLTVANGIFTAELNGGGEFGSSALNGDQRWLQIAVRCPPDVSFTTLSPRQPVTPAPYAQYALKPDGHSLDAADGSPVDAVFVGDAGTVGINKTNPQANIQLHVVRGPQHRRQLRRSGHDQQPQRVRGLFPGRAQLLSRQRRHRDNQSIHPTDCQWSDRLSKLHGTDDVRLSVRHLERAEACHRALARVFRLRALL